jgi:hypothetical protein
MIDMNEDVRSKKVKEMLAKVSMREIITEDREKEAEGTHHKGSKPIDGIFVSNTIKMRKGGYLPFGEFPSDHRGIWADFEFTNVFGFKMQDIIAPKARRLKSDDVRVRKKFQKRYKQYIKENQLDRKLYSLQQTITTPPSKDNEQKFNKIMEQRKQGLQIADKYCRKLKMGGVPYSGKYKRSVSRIAVWKAVITKHKGCKFSMSKLRRLEKDAEIENSLHTNIDRAKEELNKAYKEYWKIKKEGRKHRVEYLEGKVRDIAIEGDGDENNIYRTLLTREAQRILARRIKTTLRKFNGGGVTNIEVRNEDKGEWEIISRKEEVEKECMKENEKKYRQTESTPLMVNPLRQEIGFLGNTRAADKILEGTYNVNTDNKKYTQELLNEMKAVDNMKIPPAAIVETSNYIEG